MATAAASLPSGDETHRRQWRYTWEALGHLPLLRLYLFPRPALPDAIPSGLRADLRLDDSLLIFSFSLAGEAVSLRVPVPRVLVDPSTPVECRAAGDHVEVRLALVLPVDHPVVAAAFPPSPGAEPPAPLTLRDDLKNLSSGEVHLYCKACSTRLTKHPLRNIMEMPSLNWEDVADNWFGGCCTSFGGASEKLVANSTSSCDSIAQEKSIADVSIGKNHTAGKIDLEKYKDQANITCIQNETNRVTCQADQSGTSQLENDVDVNLEKSKNDSCIENMEKSNEEIDPLLVDPCHCCCANEYSVKAEGNYSSMSLGNQNKQTTLETKRDYTLTKTISLGSSFIIKASNLLNDFKWVELLCAQCSSSLGSYPSQCSLVPADGRVRLFKCYTSTELPVTEDEISFRTVVRDLESKRPVLQLVLLSSKAWLFSGFCYENDMDGLHGTANLQPNVKLLYSNCSNASESDLRIVEEWSSKYRAEELYMMKRQIAELIKCLSSAMDNFPSSCSSLEGMCLSSLGR
ncbi:hypothetical protein PR202_ga06374 [Eleusine coracana subsp. coracana]|uniref:Ubiquitin-conjugating enzyme E2-binding protein n=1 Tax=Eleusine coracana subsp. coracana TaxID=191504 RepID=A0AAV5BWQ5_ELECO|nr:hypothetical protein PR202_ga06374 [Eleusine coracana subsp. coracana]